jgi:hypothetical protein
MSSPVDKSVRRRLGETSKVRRTPWRWPRQTYGALSVAGKSWTSPARISSSRSSVPANPARRCEISPSPPGSRISVSLRSFAAIAILSLVLVAPAAASPAFRDGAGVAAAMERHFNSTDYRTRLGRSGGRMIGQVLCAYDRRPVCSGRLMVSGLEARATWNLEKLTASRARLSWVFVAAGARETDGAIVSPATFKLKTF